MRFLFVITALLPAVCVRAQLNKPPQLRRVKYAIEDIFRKPPPLKTTLPSIFERAQRTADGCNVSCTPLPAKFLSLKGERRSETRVSVSWETANELNTRGYDVERSLGDAMHFEKAGFVMADGAANPLSKYVFNDANNYAGISYYRLKQVDNDDKYSYSKTVAVKGYSKEELLEVYPNPAHNELQLSLTLIKTGAATVNIFDANGKLVQQVSRTFVKGGNVYPVIITALAPGAYFIRTVTPSQKNLSLLFIKK